MTKGVLLVVLLLALGGFVFLSLMAGSPRDVYAMVRFAFPLMRPGELRVGDPAPDVELTALDGQAKFHLRERIGARPLVLIFGSYT